MLPLSPYPRRDLSLSPSFACSRSHLHAEACSVAGRRHRALQHQHCLSHDPHARSHGDRALRVRLTVGPGC
eukprot:668606-Rhodomonas_salina.1